MVKDLGYWKARVAGINATKVPVLPYVPERRELPARVLAVETAWKGIESILPDLISRFGTGTESCLEFGVEHGYSTAALAQSFKCVTGIDTFMGDKHTGDTRDFYSETKERLAEFTNIRLIRSDYQNWITKDESTYDLIHVDIIHTYEDTYTCGLWSAQRSHCTLFHDTESFPAVKLAVGNIAKALNKKFYNYTGSNGLGIVV